MNNPSLCLHTCIHHTINTLKYGALYYIFICMIVNFFESIYTIMENIKTNVETWSKFHFNSKYFSFISNQQDWIKSNPFPYKIKIEL